MSEAYRPDTLQGYIGQENLKRNIGTLLDAARRDKRTVDHCLFYGISGGGKTTIARILHHEMKDVFPHSRLHSTIAPAIQSVGDLVQILLRIKEGDVLFIDEAHSLTLKSGECLYTAMEDRRVDVTIGNEVVRTLNIPLPDFTVVGATTRLSKMTQPLRDRFSGGVFRVEYYTPEQLSDILKLSASKFGVSVTPEGLEILSNRGRGTPRVALNLLKWATSTAKALDWGIDKDIALAACDAIGVDNLGLVQDHRDYLEALIKRGGVAGLSSMCRMLNREEGDVSLIETDLVRFGLMEYGDEGRQITAMGHSHMAPYMPAKSKKSRKLSEVR